MAIGLALGGGGARGMAHLGVLRLLEKEKINIGAIAGTSVGGLIGAVYLSGYSVEDILYKFSKINQDKLYGHLKSEEPSLLGFSGGTKILTEMLDDRTFRDLEIPFAVTAVDINSGQTVIIKEGKLIDAVLATIAVPGILPARVWGERMLVDGGVFDPVPVGVVRELNPKLPVVAVVLTQETAPNLTVPVPEIPGAAPVFDYIAKLRISQALNIFIQSIDVASKMLAELRLEIDQPEVLIRPELSGIGLLDKVDVVELANRGEDAIRDQIDEIRKNSRQKSGIFNFLRAK